MDPRTRIFISASLSMGEHRLILLAIETGGLLVRRLDAGGLARSSAHVVAQGAADDAG